MSADIQERQALHKASLLEGKTKGYSSCLPRQAALRLPPQLSEPGEMANSHAGHWASVQGLMGHHNLHHIYRKVCVLETYSEAACTKKLLQANAHAVSGMHTFYSIYCKLCIRILNWIPNGLQANKNYACF